MKVQFVKSAEQPADYPKTHLPELALAGRSNAGKSSFLNAFSGRSIAKVSQSPGKTRLLNFFCIEEKYQIVDMPGYGYAKRSGHETKQWQKMIETYLSDRPQLMALLLVMDARRQWAAEEQLLLDFAHGAHLPLILILSKEDKLKRNEARLTVKKMRQMAAVDDIFLISSTTKRGLQEVKDYLWQITADWYEQKKLDEA